MDNLNSDLPDRAFILKATQQSASKWRVMIFSKEKGRISAWYRPSAKQKILDPFLPFWPSFQSRPYGYILEKLEPVSIATGLKGEALLAGWYLNELILLLMPEEEEGKEVFFAYERALNQLRDAPTKEQLEIILRQFEWQFLQLMGYGISLTHEAKTGKPVEVGQFYQCVPQLGLVAASSGLAGEICLQLGIGDYSSKDMLKVAKQLTRMLLDSALSGRGLKTRALFKSLR